mmetsp:Transcript_74438/g.131640  ORF Transcript_74438/g.131640 Transcript_74438/m.131640 type:complete len:322 (+) Transcript_74438:36-1001(+)|eukprot:CAMPEP_0197636648 /NCGR_PEP_ID=MMETSP1338-20131121/12089_1 /TAXON_ID=43686 ORGANISM="Pelagodinium beii, Strain RCC1491" /NCGR_SAMPLE_ID=MMETSP1338 /ASSEMBLY_ACC=CAM_ASM_000754 /LENGTH=321 /DNA_ID=CAMNT_0043208917 /DNA_START=36 /DNA_END=1001 /DNA_ORIENTATION=-
MQLCFALAGLLRVSANQATLPAGPFVRPVRNSDDDLDSSDVALCTVDSIAAFFYLSQAGVELAGAAQDCHSLTSEDDAIGCAADVWGVLQSFVNTGAFISALVTECGTAENLPATCAASVMVFVGSLFEALEAGLSSHNSCRPANDVLSQARLLLSDGGSATDNLRSLQAAPGPVAPKTRGLDAGWCFVDVGSSGIYLAQAGVLLDIAVRESCPNQTTQDNRANCATAVSAIVAAMANVVSYMASASQRCGGSVTLGVCVGDSFSLANAFSGIASASSSFLLTCSKVIAEGNEHIGRLMGEKQAQAAEQPKPDTKAAATPR